MNKTALLHNYSPFLKLFLPIAKNGFTDHAICAVHDLIYHACVEYALKLKIKIFD